MSTKLNSRGGRAGPFERPITKDCEHPLRQDDEPFGYVAWHEWAMRKYETHKQQFCPHCRRWAIWVPKASAAGQKLLPEEE